jgi:hypothetical protein
MPDENCCPIPVGGGARSLRYLISARSSLTVQASVEGRSWVMRPVVTMWQAGEVWPRLCENQNGAGAVSRNSCSRAGKLPLSRISMLPTSPILWKTENCANETRVSHSLGPFQTFAPLAYLSGVYRNRRNQNCGCVRDELSQGRQRCHSLSRHKREAIAIRGGGQSSRQRV